MELHNDGAATTPCASNSIQSFIFCVDALGQDRRADAAVLQIVRGETAIQSAVSGSNDGGKASDAHLHFQGAAFVHRLRQTFWQTSAIFRLSDSTGKIAGWPEKLHLSLEFHRKRLPATGAFMRNRLVLHAVRLFTAQCPRTPHTGAEVPAEPGEIADIQSAVSVDDVAERELIAHLAVDFVGFGLGRRAETSRRIDDSG